ncbi:uncharacterized protein LOC110154539 [Boleophthalmus pectinirostris]|uniref:uncharacterized protein LOC110154539 n=1 Tax=Boleophthalmus pectinirostris TaxID=150288 RepID=UPI00242CDE3A|nr:uncharacterized protein LOC110154539 [Boleophthalmus pectinirostris]
MERVSVLCALLLLLCSLSGAELQDNEISDQRQASPESVNVPEQPQPCPPDLHAVLRHMSTALDEHRVKIEQLQCLNQEQTKKIREQEAELRELKTRDVETLKQQQQGQAAELNSIKTQTNVTENHVTSLRRDREGAELQDNEISDQRQASPESVNVTEQPQPCPPDLHAVLRHMSAALAQHRVKIEVQEANLRELEQKTSDVAEHRVRIEQLQSLSQVAFSASLVASGEVILGPFNTHTNLVFRHVVSNIGNAYSPNTGFFIAPVRGAYHFEWYIGAQGHTSHASCAVLVKNGEHVFISYEHQTNDYGTGANGVTLLLEAGDVVFLRQWENSRVYDNGNHRSTFSGHLLFLM